MKKHVGWSYCPYQPLLETTDLYICRVVPQTNAVTLYWLPNGDDAEYTVFCKAAEESAFREAGKTTACQFCIGGLKIHQDYDFFVSCGEKKSGVRKAHTGEAVGTVVNYLHPADSSYAFSGRFLCSPTLLQFPDGDLLASMQLPVKTQSPVLKAGT